MNMLSSKVLSQSVRSCLGTRLTNRVVSAPLRSIHTIPKDSASIYLHASKTPDIITTGKNGETLASRALNITKNPQTVENLAGITGYRYLLKVNGVARNAAYGKHVPQGVPVTVKTVFKPGEHLPKEVFDLLPPTKNKVNFTKLIVGVTIISFFSLAGQLKDKLSTSNQQNRLTGS